MRKIISRAVWRVRCAWMLAEMQPGARYELDRVTEACELASIARGGVL